MRLDEYVDIEQNKRAERRRLAKNRSYDIVEYLDDFQDRFESTVQGDSLYGGVSPSIFVGTSNYPHVSTGVLSPVGHNDDVSQFITSDTWYDEDISISDVFERRASLLNSTTTRPVTNVAETWDGDGFLGTQREIAIADHPVTVEIGLVNRPNIDFDVNPADVSTPVGPRARAESAALSENPHVPRAVEKTISDDDWNAEGAITYLYRRDFDIYDINTILSAGALGRTDQRRLVPTRWSITAVDDVIGRYLRGRIRTNQDINSVEIHRESFLGNAFWVILAPGEWEYELVEMKAPGSIWNPKPEAGTAITTDWEGREGRTKYVSETAGAYHAARLGVLEHLAQRGRRAKALILRHISADYWAPVGVWQVRETVRDTFDDTPAISETMHEAIDGVCEHLPISSARLHRASTIAAGRQATFDTFT
jgi:hypothetical protein